MDTTLADGLSLRVLNQKCCGWRYSFWAMWQGLALLFAKVRHTSLVSQRHEHKAGWIPHLGAGTVSRSAGAAVRGTEGLFRAR